jgi:seryl-tRNA synthetase
MNKVDLITKVAELEATLKANESAQTQLTKDLITAQKQLENINKPKVSEHTMDQIYLAIEDAIDNFDFDNPDSYEADFTIDYDNRLALESIRFDGASSIAEDVHNEIEKLFNVIPTEKND